MGPIGSDMSRCQDQDQDSKWKKSSTIDCLYSVPLSAPCISTSSTAVKFFLGNAVYFWLQFLNVFTLNSGEFVTILRVPQHDPYTLHSTGVESGDVTVNSGIFKSRVQLHPTLKTNKHLNKKCKK